MKNPFSIVGQGKPNPVPTSQSRFTGVFLPIEIHAYLSLFALYEKVPKSKLLREEIEKWYDKTKQSNPVDHMLSSILEIAQEEWESRKRINKNVWKGNLTSAFDIYKTEIKTSLKQKGLSKVHINLISNGLKQ